MENKYLILKLQKIEDSCSINEISKLNNNGLVYLLGKINQELKTLKKEIK
jgi:hypothetical protein